MVETLGSEPTVHDWSWFMVDALGLTNASLHSSGLGVGISFHGPGLGLGRDFMVQS